MYVNTHSGILSFHTDEYVHTRVLCVSKSPESHICKLARGCAEVQWCWWSWGDIHSPGICPSVSSTLVCSWVAFLTKNKNLGVVAGLCRFGVAQCWIIMPWMNVFNRSSYGSNGKSQNLAAAPDLLKGLYLKESDRFNPTLSTSDQVASNRSNCIFYQWLGSL